MNNIYKINTPNDMLDRFVTINHKVDYIPFNIIIFYNKLIENFEIQCLDYEKLKNKLNIKISRNLFKNEFVKKYLNTDTYNHKKFNTNYDFVNKYGSIKFSVGDSIYSFMNEKYIFSDYIKNKNYIDVHGFKYKEYKNDYVCFYVERILNTKQYDTDENSSICRSGCIEVYSKKFEVK